MAANNVTNAAKNIYPILPNQPGEQDGSAEVRGGSKEMSHSAATLKGKAQHLPFLDSGDSFTQKKPLKVGPGMPPPNTGFLDTIHLP